MKFKKTIYLSLLFLGASFATLFMFFMYPSFFLKKKATDGDGLVSIQRTGVRFLAKNVFVETEIAAEPYAWTKGLMFRESLDKDKGMLFIFPDEQKRSFWMKNVYMPLDIMFISKDKKIVDIKENFQPCTSFACDSYESKEVAMYVLEVNAGFTREHGIEIGDGIEIY